MNKEEYNKNRESTRHILLALVLISLLIFTSVTSWKDAFAIPQGATISSATTQNATTIPADSHIAQGGSFTTLVLNVTSQTSKWKAYVGNVTGRITLDNSNNQTIYDWLLTTVQGEVYVTRNSSISFNSLACANIGNITAEQNALSINASSDDSINKTFNRTVHRSFVIGSTGVIANSTCFAIATYVNDARQQALENATFQEVLLSDGRNLVYASLLENKKTGFDSSTYDFQSIVPDDPSEVSTNYYFFAELG